MVAALGLREAGAPADQSGALEPLGLVGEVQRVQHVVGASAAPVRAPAAAAAAMADSGPERARSGCLMPDSGR
jgi:hypothetical protein